MGAQLRVYRRRIRSVKATKKITKAMELISASRIVKAQQRVAASSPYADELTHAVIDGVEFVDKKLAALAEHKTQLSMDAPFFALSDDLGKNIWGYEYYTQVKGVRSSNVNEKGLAVDLFS